MSALTPCLDTLSLVKKRTINMYELLVSSLTFITVTLAVLKRTSDITVLIYYIFSLMVIVMTILRIYTH